MVRGPRMERCENQRSRKNLIFDTITKLLLEEGLTGISYAKISARCHLHINTITYYFDGKDDMLLQCFEHIVEQERSQLPSYYFRIPEDSSPVEALCRVVDHILDHGRLMSPIRRMLNMYLLPNVNLSPRVRDFLRRIDRESIEIEYRAITLYQQTGILDAGRLRSAFADLSLISSGYSLMQFFQIESRDSELALQAAKERIKKSLLKDGLYPVSLP